MKEHNCKFEEIKYIKRIPHPEYEWDRTAKYTLLQCLTCQQYYLLIDDPDEDRWGTGKSEKKKISKRTAQEIFEL